MSALGSSAASRSICAQMALAFSSRTSEPRKMIRSLRSRLKMWSSRPSWDEAPAATGVVLLTASPARGCSRVAAGLFCTWTLTSGTSAGIPYAARVRHERKGPTRSRAGCRAVRDHDPGLPEQQTGRGEEEAGGHRGRDAGRPGGQGDEQTEEEGAADDRDRADDPLVALGPLVDRQPAEERDGDCRGRRDLEPVDEGRVRGGEDEQRRPDDPRDGAEPAGGRAPVPADERALAEHRITSDVAQVLQDDPGDEPDVQGGEQPQVGGPHHTTPDEQPDEVWGRDVAGGQRERGDHATVGEPDRAETVAEHHHERRRRDGEDGATSLTPEPVCRDELTAPGHDGQYEHRTTVRPPLQEKAVGALHRAGQVDSVDPLVGEVIDECRADDERDDHGRGPQHPDVRDVAGRGQAARGIRQQQHDHGQPEQRAGHPQGSPEAGHLLLPYWLMPHTERTTKPTIPKTRTAARTATATEIPRMTLRWAAARASPSSISREYVRPGAAAPGQRGRRGSRPPAGRRRRAVSAARRSGRRGSRAAAARR